MTNQPSKDRRSILTTIWIFVLFNMIYADYFDTMKPADPNEVPGDIAPELVLVFAILMQIPIGMLLLTKLLSPHASRMVNLIGAPICIIWVTLPAFIGLEDTSLSYMFMASMETIAMVGIFWYAYTWKTEEITVQIEHG